MPYVVVIDDVVAGLIVARGQVRFGHGHAYGVGNPLTQGTCGDFYPNGMWAVFGMTGGFAAPLAEFLQFFQRQVIPAQMQQRIQQHAAMTG